VSLGSHTTYCRKCRAPQLFDPERLWKSSAVVEYPGVPVEAQLACGHKKEFVTSKETANE